MNLTTTEITEYASEMVQQMSHEDRIGFALDPSEWKDGITTNHTIANRDGEDVYIQTSEEWDAVKDSILSKLREVGTIVECAYCGEEYVADDYYFDDDGYVQHGTPPADNERAWDELAKQHLVDCEWIHTRAHQLDA